MTQGRHDEAGGPQENGPGTSPGYGLTSDSRIEAVLNNVPVTLFAFDAAGVFTMIEGRNPRIPGYENMRDFVGVSIYDVFPNSPREALESTLARALGGEDVQMVERIGGTDFDIRMSPQRDESGAIRGVFGVALDITDRLHAEAALRASEMRYRAVVENQMDLVCRYLPDLTLTFVNEAYCDYFNQSRGDLLGVNFRDHLPPDELAVLEAHLKSLTPARPVGTIEHRVYHGAGEIRWIQWKDQAFFDEHGRLTELQSVGRDITQWRHAQDELSKRVSLLAIAQQVDVELNQTLQMDLVLTVALNAAVLMSHADAGFIGLIEGDYVRLARAVGKYSETMMKPNVGIIARVLRTTRAALVLDVRSDPDYYVDIAETRAQITVPLISHDKLLGVLNLETAEPSRFTQEVFEFIQLLAARIAVAIDNAQLYQVSQTQLGELRSLEQLKTDMIRIAAHDLRSPLGIISGYVDLLCEDLSGHMNEQHHVYIDSIMRAVKRMQHMTTDILSLERVQNKDAALWQIVYLSDLIERAMLDYYDESKQKGLEFNIRLPEDSILVQGDPTDLYEAISNLIGNAIKYTPQGGRVDVLLKKMDGWALLEIEDTGFGVPVDLQSNLFKPFYRAKTQETQHIDGTGLGLYLVKSIVERHGGKMRFRSTYGKGSVFGFQLPLVPELSVRNA